MNKKISVLLVVFMGLAASASAQSLGSFSGFGLKGGVTSANLRFDEDDEEGPDRRTSFSVGAFGTVPLSPLVALQPEVLYIRKGAGSSFSDDEIGEFEATTKLDYIEVPVLAKVTLPTAGSLVPSLYAGPYAALAINREVEFEANGESGSEDVSDAVKRFDYGVSFGADVAFTFSGQALTLGARYDLGLANINDEELEEDDDQDLTVGNGAFAIMLGFAL